MKSRVFFFIFIAGVVLLSVPAMNLWWVRTNIIESGEEAGNAKGKANIPWWSRESLYRMDFLMPWLGRMAYPFGISISPNQVIIGKDDWLFLGDKYARTISAKRVSATAKDLARIKRIMANSEAWWRWLKKQGVKFYRIQIAPDASSIYPEYLPDWVQPVKDHATNQLRERVSSAIYVDNKQALLAAKSRYSEPLYYRTDSHWNSLGAWVAYLDLAGAIDSAGVSGIHWLTPDQITILDLEKKSGGGLANFLWMKDILTDTDVPVKIDIGRPLTTKHIDFNTGKPTRLSENPIVGAPLKPKLVRSPNALNKSRLLWLRDSFGTAMSPYIAATFGETLQLHFKQAKPEDFIRLVKELKPDYVIVTTVERDSLASWFYQPPPAEKSILTIGKGEKHND